jgi:hypothetical protein
MLQIFVSDPDLYWEKLQQNLNVLRKLRKERNDVLLVAVREARFPRRWSRQQMLEFPFGYDVSLQVAPDGTVAAHEAIGAYADTIHLRIRAQQKKLRFMLGFGRLGADKRLT